MAKGFKGHERIAKLWITATPCKVALWYTFLFRQMRFHFTSDQLLWNIYGLCSSSMRALFLRCKTFTLWCLPFMKIDLNESMKTLCWIEFLVYTYTTTFRLIIPSLQFRPVSAKSFCPHDVFFTIFLNFK